MLLPPFLNQSVVDVVFRVSVKTLGNPLKIGLAVDSQISIFRTLCVHIVPYPRDGKYKPQIALNIRHLQNSLRVILQNSLV